MQILCGSVLCIGPDGNSTVPDRNLCAFQADERNGNKQDNRLKHESGKSPWESTARNTIKEGSFLLIFWIIWWNAVKSFKFSVTIATQVLKIPNDRSIDLSGMPLLSWIVSWPWGACDTKRPKMYIIWNTSEITFYLSSFLPHFAALLRRKFSRHILFTLSSPTLQKRFPMSFSPEVVVGLIAVCIN